MTSTDGNDFVPAQEKLEWVTPKISLMVAEDTEGTGKPFNKGETYGLAPLPMGPS